MKITRNRLRAFTLVEIMVVLAIMGILLGMAVVNFKKMNEKEPLEEAVSQVEGMCRRARSEAIVKSRPMDLTFEITAGLLRLATAPRAVSTPDVETGALTSSTEESITIESALLPREVVLAILQPEDPDNIGSITIRFYANGTAEPLEAELGMDGEGVYLLKLDPVTGQVSAENQKAP